MIKINDIELEDIDLMDADTMEIVEEIMRKAKTESERISKINSFAEMIREQCNYVSECFDKLFGEGTSEKLFEGKSNMRTSIIAFEELMKVLGKQREDAEKEFSKYTPNRASRRK